MVGFSEPALGVGTEPPVVLTGPYSGECALAVPPGPVPVWVSTIFDPRSAPVSA